MRDSLYWIGKARTQMLLKYPFFGTLALYLEPKVDPSTPSMRTEGFTLSFNDEFVQDLVNTGGVKLLMGYLVHEVMHSALQHIWRRSTRDPKLWDMACDYVVNQIVTDQGLPLPPDALLDERFEEMTAEAVYNILKEENPPNKNSSGAGVISFSGQNDSETYEPSGKVLDDHSKWGKNKFGQDESDDTNKDASTWKMRTAQVAQQKGHLPSRLKQLIERLLYPKVDWRQALASFVQPTRSDYTFIPPDRRFDYVFLPEFGNEGIEEVVVAIDTSGSVWRFYKEFISELVGIVFSYPEFRGYIAFCDAAVQLFEELDPESIPMQFKGGGGTNFRPLFQEVEKRSIDPSFMVFLTDGNATFPKEPPSYPVLWVLTGENQPIPPFGAVAYMNLE